MSAEYLSLLESTLGGKLSKKRIERLRDARRDPWFDGIRQELEDLATSSSRFPMPDSRQRPPRPTFRPYLPFDPNDMGKFIGALPFAPIDFFKKARSGDPLYQRPELRPSQTSKALSRHLLYCDSIAIDDPLYWISGAPTLDPKVHDNREVDHRASTLDYLTMLADFRPLIAADRLVILPIQFAASAPPRPWRGDIRVGMPESVDVEDVVEAHRGRDVPLFTNLLWPDITSEPNDGDLGKMRDHTIRAWSQCYGDGVVLSFQDANLARYYSQLFLHQALDEMASQLIRVFPTGDGLAFSTPFRIHEQALRLLVEATGLSAGRHGIDRDRATTLAGLPLPQLDTVSPATLAELAAHDDVFTAWRVGLGKALDRIQYNTDDVARVQAILAEETYEPLARLLAHIEGKKLSSAAREATRIFCFGSIALGVSTGVGAAMGADPSPATLTGAAVGVAASSMARVAWTYMSGSSARRKSDLVNALLDLFNKE